MVFSLKTCKGCNRRYSDDVWLHEELKICSICYSKRRYGIKTKKKKGIDKWINVQNVKKEL